VGEVWRKAENLVIEIITKGESNESRGEVVGGLVETSSESEVEKG
jgi:hypothetical protein